MRHWLLLLLLVPSPVCATWTGTVWSGINFQGTLTKLSEGEYEFVSWWIFEDYWIPLPETDPVTGLETVYGIYPNFAASIIGAPESSYDLNLREGYFKSEEPPIQPMEFLGFANIESLTHLPGDIYSRWLPGEILGETTIFGDVPQLVGQSTTWNAVPEPFTASLLFAGLLLALRNPASLFARLKQSPPSPKQSDSKE